MKVAVIIYRDQYAEGINDYIVDSVVSEDRAEAVVAYKNAHKTWESGNYEIEDCYKIDEHSVYASIPAELGTSVVVSTPHWQQAGTSDDWYSK